MIPQKINQKLRKQFQVNCIYYIKQVIYICLKNCKI